MSKNPSMVWNTKYGPRRVRHEAPTVQEAIAAAQGLSDELEEQVDIASGLIGMPRDQVRAEIMKFSPPRKDIIKTVAFAGTAAAPRAVVVERKPARRLISSANRTVLVRKLSTAR